MSNFIQKVSSKAGLLVVALSSSAFVAFGGAAHAQTSAGTPVDNTFTLNYDVAGVEQPQITNDPGAPGDNGDGPTRFTVDRLIDLTLGADPTDNVTPGAQILVDGGGAALDPDTPQPAVLSFVLQNTGNDTQAYTFSLENGGGDFDVLSSAIIFYEDPASPGDFIEINAVAQGGTAGVNITPDIPAGGTLNVFVVAAIPETAANMKSMKSILVAETRVPVNWAVETGAGAGGINTDAGDVVIAVNGPSGSGAANVNGSTAQNFFADGDGDGADVDNDGIFGNTGTFIVVDPTVSGQKEVFVIATDGDATGFDCGAFDPSPGTATDQFAVPGACIEYVISVVNDGADDAGGTPLPAEDTIASNIDIEDILPAEVVFLSAEARNFVDNNGDPSLPTPVAGTVAASATGPVICDGTATTCRVAFENGTLAADTAQPGTVVIRALVQ